MIKMNMTLSFITLYLLFSILGQGGSCRTKEANMNEAPLEKSDGLAAGVWGGEHIRMQVTSSGAQIQYDCAHSTIEQTIRLDRQGRFDATGKLTRERGGPVIPSEEARSSPVRYAGQVNGSTMTLSMKHDVTGEDLGSYTLARGNQGRVMKCR